VQISFPADLSLHAGVSTEAHQRDKLEWSGGVPLCRNVSRLAVSEKRLALNPNANVSFGGLPPKGVTLFYLEDC
jgi:hypothetical protein